MMDSIRSAASGWAAKVLIGLLALSFAIWGVNDVFFGFRSEVLASVGDREVSTEEYRRLFDQRLRTISRQSGRGLTAEEARQVGLDRQVLAAMLGDAALEEQARLLKLAVPRETVALDIARNEAFQNARGEFDPTLFRRLLAENGIDEQAFLSAEMTARVRRAIAETIVGDFSTPETLVEAVVRQSSEERDARYFEITPSESEIAVPSESELVAFYDRNRQLFTTPAYRSLVLLILQASDLAAKMNVTEVDLKAAYERRREEYGTPESRVIEQITFPSLEEAQKAKQRIAAGADFLTVAKEKGLSEKDLSLGNVRKSDIADEALAAAAFALAEGSVSDPVQGRLSTALLRVTRITPGATKTFEQVRDDLLAKLKLEKAQEEIEALHAKVEDERAGGASFEDIAKTVGIPLRDIRMIDTDGRDADGKVVEGIPAKAEVLRLAFDSDVGVETDPISMGDDGVVWVDIRDAKPSGVKPLSEVRDKAVAAFKAQKLRDSLLGKARDIARKGDAGATIEDLAKEAGATVKTANGVRRNEPSQEFDGLAVAALFSAPDNGFAFAPKADGKGAKIMQALPVVNPPFDPKSKESETIRTALERGITNDLLAVYVAAVQRELGVSVNDAVWRQLSGTGGQ